MISKKLVIFGNGGLASVVKFHCENVGFTIAGFSIDEEYLHSEQFEDLPNVSYQKILKYFSPHTHLLFIAIGASDMLGFVRQNRINTALVMGYELFSFAFVNDTLRGKIELGANTIILPGVTVDPFVKFGSGVIAWSGSTICHHTTIGDYSFVSPGATICGKVSVGEHCFIGGNSTVRDNLIIAPRSILGAGVVINQDTDPDGVYMPARHVRINKRSNEIMFTKDKRQ